MSKKINQPIIEFLEFFLHLHKLNSFLISSISRYEKLSDTIKESEKLLSIIKKEEIEVNIEKEKYQEELKLAIRKEIEDNYYTLKTSEIILIYSRLESAISEMIFKYFENYSYHKIKDIESLKVNAVSFIKLTKKAQINLITEQYISTSTQSIKYGFNRFESILKPILGPSKLPKNYQDSLFRFAQIRNLLIHKNGIIDKQFKLLYKSPKFKLNQRINIDQEIISDVYNCTIQYTSDILDRIKLVDK